MSPPSIELRVVDARSFAVVDARSFAVVDARSLDAANEDATSAVGSLLDLLRLCLRLSEAGGGATSSAPLPCLEPWMPIRISSGLIGAGEPLTGAAPGRPAWGMFTSLDVAAELGAGSAVAGAAAVAAADSSACEALPPKKLGKLGIVGSDGIQEEEEFGSVAVSGLRHQAFSVSPLALPSVGCS